MNVFKRVPLSVAGGLLGALIAAWLDARASGSEALGAAFAADFGVLAPLAAIVSLVVALAHGALEPGEPVTPRTHLARLNAEPVLSRTRTASLVPLVVVSSFLVVVGLANFARVRLGEGEPGDAGALLACGALVGLALGAWLVLVLLAPVRRAVAAGYERHTWLLEPAKTGGAALALVSAAFVFGILAGDTGGDGAWPLGVFGVLKRSELDLRPVTCLGVIATFAYAASVVFARRPASRVVPACALVVLASSLATVKSASALDASMHLTRALERAPLGHYALALDRRATDKDKDGVSRTFGHGDCDDRDPRRNPGAIDVPGNDIDEDCSGADTPKPAPPPVAPPVKVEVAAPPDLNLVFITIDTLRPDVGFMGYGKPTTKKLDALADQGTVFDRAYSLASYTGKSIGPMLIGRYPSETDRDGGHFNKYGASNVFVAERLHDAGIHTMGAASHWYFQAWSGLTQGMDEWDISAKPSEGQGDNDTSVTSKELSDAAIRMLENHQKKGGSRFFLWLHYFDPHEQYMPHDKAPSFEGAGILATRAAYDGEVWFTDQHIGRVLDYVRGQAFADRTAIVVTSDHGEAFGEHDMSWHGVEVWESLVHVPLIVYVPGQKPHHVAEKRSQIDLVPTILDIMRAPADPSLPGKSLLGDVLGEAPYEERDVLIDMPVGPYTLMRKAILVGESPGRKLIYSGGKSYQLYDLATDPDEAHDLSSDPAMLDPVLARFEAARAGLREIEVKPEAP